jgi:hypothetical protein
MRRPSKRLIAIRTSGAVRASKRRKTRSREEEIPDSFSDGGAPGEEGSSSSEVEGVIEDEPEDDCHGARLGAPRRSGKFC